ncbi:MAG: general secretion pathway protein GspB [Nevskia sp.]|nr:general secretion pathway protein GspB [Nevskia sp.]
MSYILDALKRAERERKQGKASVLDEVPGGAATPAPRQLPRPWLAGLGAVILTAVVAFALLHGRHTPKTAVASAPPAQPAAPPQAAVVPPPPVPAPEPAGPPPAATQEAAAAPAASATIEDNKIATLDDVYGEPAPPPPQPTEAETEQAAPPPPPPRVSRRPPAPAPATDVPTRTIPPDESETAETTAPAAVADHDMPAPPAPATAMAQGNRPAAPPAGGQALHEMPESYRAAFPAISIDVLAYNDNPQRRFALIDGKSYREGDVLAEGPRIIGIVPEGIVFDWRGQQVLYPVTH